MNSHIHDTVRKLMELHSLEDRLVAFETTHEKSGEIEAALKSVRAQIPEFYLLKHDKLRARGKRSVAELRHNVCSGCHMQLATGLVPLLMHRDSLHACENCGRLLYVLRTDKSESAPASASQPAKPVKVRKARKVKAEAELVSC